ncbi:hypothetical protein [Nostoc sp. CHAB 5715]|nr:hypothetical protein [Nostoc sp. CHAB 5715]
MKTLAHEYFRFSIPAYCILLTIVTEFGHKQEAGVAGEAAA